MANAGLVVAATLSARLGIAQIVKATVRMAGLVGGAQPARKVLTLVHAMVAGASHITTPTSSAPGTPAGCSGIG